MEGRLRILLLSTLQAAGLWSGAALAAGEGADRAAAQQQVIQPRLDRREVGIDEIDSEDFEVSVFGGLLSTEDFGTNPVIGARLAYHVTEGVFFEAAYGRSTTTASSVERIYGGLPALTDSGRILSYYNVSVGYNLLPGEAFVSRNWAFRSALYVIGGAGSTSFAGDDRFTINFGAGYRFIATDWLAIHLDVRDHVFDIDVLGYSKTAHNLETTAGVSVFF